MGIEVLGLSDDSVMETAVRLGARAFRAEVLARHCAKGDQRDSSALVPSHLAIIFKHWARKKFVLTIERRSIKYAPLSRIFQGGA